MSVTRKDQAILLIGDCLVEDAETLLALLIANPALPVDVSACGRLHTAVAQILLAVRPPVSGVPLNSFVATWLLPHVLDVPLETTSIDDRRIGRAAEPAPE